ncbi:MAG TPA: DUF3857 and transglutaminase domain-containing protein [Blastocatellia bacterium]|nr:DUF3857 and transglutaminase domain-containing protein [Blastocatellia bacterium]
MRSKTLSLMLTLVVFACPVLAGDDVPAWLRQVAAIAVPTYDKEVTAVTLHDDARVTVDENGKVVTITMHAVRILSRDGRSKASATTIYNTDSEKVKDMRAWMLRPNGQVIKYGKDQTIDGVVDDNDVYDEARRRLISGKDDAEPGAVFGYEIVVESKDIFASFPWGFGDSQPVLSSSISVTVPSDWRAEGVVFIHPKIEPSVNGSTYTWQARNLDGIKPESGSPSLANLVPRMVVRIFPPAGKSAGLLRTFESWTDVSRYMSEISDPQVQLDDALAGKARELTAQAKTEFEKIQVIGRYAQSIKYVSIQIGAGRGGGYRPHSSLEVFRKSYGDCKDKANLMRAMLKALNIQAYPVIIYSGDPTYVREEWPSPGQFNHCIIAVKVSAETTAATIVTHPKLGRLLIFDATDEDTPVGDLPDHEQGSLALIVAANDGLLMRMPTTPPEANKLVRQAEVTLNESGNINAKISERSIGQAAVNERRLFKALAKPDYVKRIEHWITRGITGANVSRIEPTDNHAEGKFALDVEFVAQAYGQSMRGKLLVFKPALVAHRFGLDLTEPKRKHPLVLEAEAFSETVRVKLPEGFEVDEIPDAAKLEMPFGMYSANFEVKDGHLIFTRQLEVKAMTIPAALYPVVREFFGRVRGVEVAPVVLAKK